MESIEIAFDETEELIDLKEAMLGFKKGEALLFMPKNSGLEYISPNLQLAISCLSVSASGMK